MSEYVAVSFLTAIAGCGEIREKMKIASKSSIRVVVVDDHPLVRIAMSNSIQEHSSMTLVAMCKSSEELLPVLANEAIDVLVLDYILGNSTETDGLQLIKQIRAHYPKLRILMYSAIESPALVQVVLKAGVKGYIGKSCEPEELMDAVIKVASGKRVLSRDLQYALDKFSVNEKSMQEYVAPREDNDKRDIDALIRDLSPRENEVVRCYLEGMSIQEIAIKFNRSRKTVSGQKQGALRKLGLKSDLELFRFRDFWLKN